MSKITIPFGPQHVALKEPENFMLVLEGEQIQGATVNLGYNHRGMEKAAEERTYLQDLYLIERVCGICSHSHTTCYITNVEELAKAETPKRALAIRTLVAELERVHSHLLWLGVAGYEMGFETLFMYTWRDREQVLDCLELLSGNRVHYSINTLGGVRRDVSAEQRAEVMKRIDYLVERTNYYIKLATEEPTIYARTSKVGMLPPEEALRRNAVGPTARASGIARDVRKDDPYLIYNELDFKVITHNTNDVFGRLVVRALELVESYKMIKQVLNNLPEGPIAVKVPMRIAPGEAVNHYEAPRGEDIHYLKSNGTDKPERLKVRAPTLANLQSVQYMLEGGWMADVPLVIAAIDPCMSCTDRAVVWDPKKGKKQTYGWEELRKMAIDQYKRRGVDFSRLG
ncbi:MAG TPA: NADH dehydrogenase subunit [Elusimicrobia bacterium]|nr:MAG: NADH dehydrogenase [Elusimicrobia bacterium GWA2_64_40]OGR63449.1 MAG: NADH dehydrogenase [Elusimicrobia bacterium GWB2_63_16]HAN05709.1 NADH dehydrogenase subunit [Elusimicrobiota bacterium]HAU90033.1 NADH dehydrogenase subunit [Elusimicrobiota bacterium]